MKILNNMIIGLAVIIFVGLFHEIFYIIDTYHLSALRGGK